MTPLPQWYAVYTKPKWEKKVAALLSQKGVVNYCPLNRVQKQWHDRKKWVEELLFPSYVFVCIATEEFTEVRKTDGVLNFVYWLGNPVQVQQEEITVIKRFLGEYTEVMLEKAGIQLGDTVQITQGPLLAHEGRVVDVQCKTVKVLLPSLGYLMVAQVEKNSVEALQNNADNKKAG